MTPLTKRRARMLKLMTSVFACLATSAAAQTPNLEAGGDLFLYFCAECHGKNGRQAGPTGRMALSDPARSCSPEFQKWRQLSLQESGRTDRRAEAGYRPHRHASIWLCSRGREGTGDIHAKRPDNVRLRGHGECYCLPSVSSGGQK